MGLPCGRTHRPEADMSKTPTPHLSRRRVFAGAGTVGALAAAAAVLPLGKPATQAAAEPKAAPDPTGGYQLTEHVKRYYETTKV
jgi:hypothetical protein